MLRIPCLKWALSTGVFALRLCIFCYWAGRGGNAISPSQRSPSVCLQKKVHIICYLVTLQELTSPSVPVSSERVSQHRHSDEERAGPM